ncbi:hypothetical protein BDV97DRAFT_348743 [Delphinella strobiligena]|nr:hypothetical protein BDV97DRAFT_348743 [Delphinella strobiligena]
MLQLSTIIVDFRSLIVRKIAHVPTALIVAHVIITYESDEGAETPERGEKQLGKGCSNRGKSPALPALSCAITPAERSLNNLESRYTAHKCCASRKPSISKNKVEQHIIAMNNEPDHLISKAPRRDQECFYDQPESRRRYEEYVAPSGTHTLYAHHEHTDC